MAENARTTRIKTVALLLSTLGACALLRTAAQDMPTVIPSVIGRIEGDDLEVKTATPTGLEINGAPTVVGSGSEVTLHSGGALLSLNGGGEISVCGPAHFKVLKSGAAVTLALDYGRVRPSLTSVEGFSIYTPTIIATPIAISGSARDVTLGLNENGEMCILSDRGAMRVETQFSNQSLLVPQGGAATLQAGQILAGRGNPAVCSCEYVRPETSAPVIAPVAAAPVTPLTASQPKIPEDIGAMAHPAPPESRTAEASPPPPVKSEEPTYTVLMPPLRFDANAPIPAPDPSPETILLVRQVRLRPTATFHGHVEAAPAARPQAVSSAPAPASTARAAEAPPAPAQRDVVSRMWKFLRGLAGSNH
jgi:hypothetical protein